MAQESDAWVVTRLSDMIATAVRAAVVDAIDSFDEFGHCIKHRLNLLFHAIAGDDDRDALGILTRRKHIA